MSKPNNHKLKKPITTAISNRFQELGLTLADMEDEDGHVHHAWVQFFHHNAIVCIDQLGGRDRQFTLVNSNGVAGRMVQELFEKYSTNQQKPK